MLKNGEKQNWCFIWYWASLFLLAFCACVDQHVLNQHSSVMRSTDQCCSAVCVLWVSSNKTLTFPWRFSPNTTPEEQKGRSCIGLAAPWQHVWVAGTSGCSTVGLVMVALGMNQSCRVLGAVTGGRWKDAVAFRGHFFFPWENMCLATEVVSWVVGRSLCVGVKCSKIRQGLKFVTLSSTSRCKFGTPSDTEILDVNLN